MPLCLSPKLRGPRKRETGAQETVRDSALMRVSHIDHSNPMDDFTKPDISDIIILYFLTNFHILLEYGFSRKQQLNYITRRCRSQNLRIPCFVAVAENVGSTTKSLKILGFNVCLQFMLLYSMFKQYSNVICKLLRKGNK